MNQTNANTYEEESRLLSKEGLSFFYTNADQFVNKRDDLLMRITNNEPDVILITEVIPKKQENPITQALIDIDGYNCLPNFDPDERNLGASGIRGVAIYTKRSLKVESVEIKVDDTRDHAWIEIPTTSGEKILCGCVYRSPSGDSDAESLRKSTSATIKLIKEAYRRNPNILIAGDFNYKEIDWLNENAPPRKDYLFDFIENLQDCFLHQHVTEPTRYRENETPSLLDLILSSEEGMVHDLAYGPPLGESDHLCLTFKLHHHQDVEKSGPRRNIFKTDYDAVTEDLMKHNWQEVLNSSFSADYETFFQCFHKSLESHTPLRKSPKARKNIYMTDEAIRLKNAKRKLWKRYLSTRAKRDREKYIESKNNLRTLTRNLRRNYEFELSSKVKSTPKLFWKYAQSRLKSRQSIPTLSKPDNSKVTSPQEKADTLNEYFSSVFTHENLNNIPSPPTYAVDEVLSTIQITPEIVRKKLQSLNPNKSPGHDAVHPYCLKELADSICIPLSILFRKSLKEGAHESWRKAIITAIHKKGSRSAPENYRPISLTSVISKIMESIVRDAILSHMMKNNLLNDAQHGFVPGRDCITQLLLCLEDWTSMIENGDMFDIIYTDFSKAFDSVAHKRLLQKLESIGIRGDLLNWIKSFLNKRTQCVNVDGKLSKWIKVISGIPQGSVLGPLLFVIFINDMPDEVKFSICKLFADDCKLYGTVGDAENKLQMDLANLEHWSKSWQLPFNATKCKVMHLGYKNPKKTYHLNDQVLDVTDSEKDLGVIIDNSLRFHDHTASAVKKANQILGVIKKSYNTRDKTTICTLYKGLVRPHLEYGNAIWGPFLLGDIRKVEAVQRRATKLIPNLQDKPYQDRLKALELPSLVYRRMRGDMILMYKVMNGLVRIDRSLMFTPMTLNNTRGHPQKVFKHHATKLPRTNSFSQRTVNDWDTLPRYVIEAPSINSFKERLDNHWERLMYTTID